ncbi:hypothetical protein IAT40_001864 [Kwoniella sp. CBS 6097]
MLRTPPRLPPTLLLEESAKTPGPTKARLNHLQNQVSELVRKNQALERKLSAEQSLGKALLNEKVSELSESKLALRAAHKELERCKSEGDGMRDELHLHSIVQQQKALLALAQEQMQVVELEQRLVQAEKARIMRDHKLALFRAREDELVADLAERDDRLAKMEAALSEANTSLAHQQASSQLTSSTTSKELVRAQTDLTSARNEIATLEDKVQVLEVKVKGLKEKEKEARSELDSWLREEQGKQGSESKMQKELQGQIKKLKGELTTRSEELGEAKEELEEMQRSGKEREKTLKIKLREANEERDRLLGVEEELEALKASKSRESIKDKARKASPVEDESDRDVVAPKKKPKKAVSPVRATKAKVIKLKVAPEPSSDSDSETPATKPKSTASAKSRGKSPSKSRKALPLEASEVVNQPLTETKANPSTKSNVIIEVSAPDPVSEDDAPAAPAPVVAKKKKRLLGGAKPAFEWDSIMGSGEGPIPAGLSPMKPLGGRIIGTIPRAGLSAASRLNRIG